MATLWFKRKRRQIKIKEWKKFFQPEKRERKYIKKTTEKKNTAIIIKIIMLIF